MINETVVALIQLQAGQAVSVLWTQSLICKMGALDQMAASLPSSLNIL